VVVLRQLKLSRLSPRNSFLNLTRDLIHPHNTTTNMSAITKHTEDGNRGKLSLKCLAGLLDNSDTHEKRTAVVQAYSWLLETLLFSDQVSEHETTVVKAVWKTSLEAAAAAVNSYTTPRKSDALTFHAVWDEIKLLKDSYAQYINQDQAVPKDTALQDLRLESHVSFILWDLSDHHDSRFESFVQQVAAEKPRYFDRPSNCDEMILHRNGDDDFPGLSDLLSPSILDEGTAGDLIALMIHHVVYACALFQQTNFEPSEEVIRALVDLRVQQVSSMLSEPLCRMSLRARQHCATMNAPGVQEFVVYWAREMLQYSPTEELTWRMYKWFVFCVQRVMSDRPGSLAGMLSGYDLMPLLEPTTVPLENFIPGVTRTL
jgi:hypothetical protein